MELAYNSQAIQTWVLIRTLCDHCTIIEPFLPTPAAAPRLRLLLPLHLLPPAVTVPHRCCGNGFSVQPQSHLMLCHEAHVGEAQLLINLLAAAPAPAAAGSDKATAAAAIWPQRPTVVLAGAAAAHSCCHALGYNCPYTRGRRQ